MCLQKLDIYRVRNIVNASIRPATFNLIYGQNGSGKSSLLEAIFILGRASSFRTNNVRNIINENFADLVVSGQVEQENGILTHLGIQFTGKECEIHINQNSKCKRSDLAYALPIQLIHPKSYQLLDGGSGIRREFIDWGLFNQNDTFLSIWRNYKKTLLQRNAILKSRLIKQIAVWDNELVTYAKQLTILRAQYLEELSPFFYENCRYFLNLKNISIKFLPGWDSESDFLALLHQDLEKDLRYGFTQHGPHRSDFSLMVNNKLAKDFVSRGQLKLLVLSLKIAQIQLLRLRSSKMACILIDDLTAELDIFNRNIFLDHLINLKIQVFISATELNEFGDFQSHQSLQVFHVEHGKIQQA